MPLIWPTPLSWLRAYSLDAGATVPEEVRKPSQIALPAIPDSPLFKLLPGELRNIIYAYALVKEENISVTRQSGIPEPALLSTCKAIRKEVIGMFYCQNELHLNIEPFEVTVLMLWHQKRTILFQASGVEVGATRMVKTGRRKWVNLMTWMRLQHAGKVTAASSRPPKYKDEDHTTKVMFGLAARFGRDGQPWAMAEGGLRGFRKILVKSRQDWAEQAPFLPFPFPCSRLLRSG